MPGVLVAYDGSEAAARALQRAADLAGGERVDVVIAAPRLRLPGSAIDADDPHAGLAAAAQGATDALAERGVEARIVQAMGRPADVILDVAREGGHDVIVVGARGATGLARLLGSTSKRVVEHAPCDVLVVR